MYQNYVFDFYGTLVDIHTDENIPAVWQTTSQFYASHGAPFTPDELFRAYTSNVDMETEATKRRHPEFTNVDIKIEKVFRRLYEMKGVTADDELIRETARIFRSSSREYIKLYDGIDELLHELKKHGKVYLLTNAQRAFTWDEIGIVGIRALFDGIIISSDEECCKPDRRFFETIIERFDLDPKQTVMVGNDPIADVRGAQQVGFDTLYIHTNISPALDYSTGCTHFIPDGDTLKMKDYLI